MTTTISRTAGATEPRVIRPLLAYVAGAYRDARGPYYIRENIRRAERVAVDLWKHGIPALCPHLNTALLDGVAPDEVFLQGDLLMMERCDVVVLVPGWLKSSGTCAEVKRAEALGIRTVEFGEPEYLAWLAETAPSLNAEAGR